ncbi:hypothetical protein LPB86_11340 [Pedobacter sp. MC2016-14]|uniref:sialate O-acetylesterase n=1 Tax=Pedobacter sp. MC2016-14 TaxID=2897327 RepID=UPI001E59FBA5|nr:sialate O-acetylesterase [Pedobacter sp. MC2016-14]MCD0488828.1 hypothetical protein [Pedobacter sp. MC2016-14]
MKRTLVVLLLLVFSWQVKAQEDMDIFLLIGQSNMAGRGELEGQRIAMDSIYMLDKYNNWVPASEPIHFDKPAAGSGLAASFAVSVRKPGRKVGLIPCAVGGTRIEAWKPNVVDSATGYVAYNDAISRSKVALKSGTLRGILWHQGEGNSSKERYKTYEEHFENLLANLGRDLSIDMDKIPVIMGELGYFYVSKMPLEINQGMYINAISHRLAQKKINRYCVSAEGLTDKGDKTHFDTPSLRELGKRYAEGYQIVKARMDRYGLSSLNKMIKQQKSLVAFWDFSDSTGRPVAGTAKDVQLFAFGQSKFSREGPLSGNCIELDGEKDYWAIAHEKSGKLDVKTNAVTVMAWVKWSGKTGFVAGKWNEYQDGGKRQYGLFVSLPYYNGAQQVCGHISKNGGATAPFPYSIDYSASPQEVLSDKWACVAFTYDGKYIKSYLNGVFMERKAELIKNTAGFFPDKPAGIKQIKNPYYYPDGIGNMGSDFTVGAVQLKKGMGNFFKGKIGGLAVFDTALSEEEMGDLAVMPGE